MLKRVVFVCIVLLLSCVFMYSASADELEDTETASTEDGISKVDQRVINNVNRDLGNYWLSERAKMEIENPVSHWLYRPLLNFSGICKRAFLPVALLGIVVGVAMQVISGMHTPLKRTGKIIMIAVPVLAAVAAYGVPIAASIFFYGS